MIDIDYHRKYNRLTATGHAQSGEPGHDLVCASVSALVLTLAANVEGLAQAGTVREHFIKAESGDAMIACVPVRNMVGVVTLVFETVVTGLRFLAETYPEYISITEYE